jgi:carbonic anhydrase
MVPKRIDALRRYRRQADAFRDEAPSPVQATFVACSECHQVAALLAATEPRCLVQNLGGGVAGELTTIAYSVQSLGVRHVVLCGHAGCVARERSDGADDGSKGHVLSQARAVREASALRSLFDERQVQVHVLWFDEREGDIHAWDPSSRRFHLMGDDDVVELLSTLESAPRLQ